MGQKYLNLKNANAMTSFPYVAMDVVNDQNPPRPPGFLVMHWHEDFQFIVVLAGSVILHTLNRTTIVHAGEGVFINRRVVHLVLGTSGCHYQTFVFPERFVTFYPGSPAEQYSSSLSENEELPTFVFSPKTPWCQSVLELLAALAALEQRPPAAYPYEVLVLLSRIWLILICNLAPIKMVSEDPVTKRMRLFLQYIACHYSEGVSLQELAASANVSKSECLRCFRLSLQTTPYQYLLEFRLSKAAALLEHSDKSIGEIACLVGFHQVSHLGKCFKEKTGYAPREYRKMASAKGCCARS